jgi:hypothetical protein
VWEKEMKHAYKVLEKAGHPDIKNNIINSQRSFIEYADNESEVHAAVSYSDAFGDEMGQLNDSINYGTISRADYSYTLAELYKQRTIDIFKYFDEIRIQSNFVFNPNNFSEEEKRLFK